MRLHRTTAAGTAVADGVKAAQHRILEKGMVHVTAIILRLQDRYGLFRRDPAGATRVMFADETGERFADNEAYVQWLAGIGASGTTRALERHDVVWMLQHDVPGARVWYDAFQIFKPNVLLNRDQLGGRVQGHDLAVIPIRPGAVLVSIVGT
jgi:hypothetical protein